MFGLNERVKRYFTQFKERPTDPLPMKYVAASGIIAGIGCAIVSVSEVFIVDSSVTCKDTHTDSGQAQQTLYRISTSSNEDFQ
jgi:hypothetical protein